MSSLDNDERLSTTEFMQLLESISEDEGKADFLKQLIDAGIDLNRVLDESSNLHPIHWACDYGNRKAVELLLTHGIDIDEPDETFMPKTPMEHAAQEGHVELVRFLFEKGANITDMTKFCIGENEEIKEILGVSL